MTGATIEAGPIGEGFTNSSQPETTQNNQQGSPRKGHASFFQRSALGQCIWTFRREFAWICVFSFFTNVLMLTPTIYMLQVYDRVMLSGNELTLGALTLLMLLFYAVMAFADGLRSRLLVRAGAKFDLAINSKVFDASFEAKLRGSQRNALQPLADLTQLRQFLTGPGVFAVVDTPWTLVYLTVLFLMHPVLGWTSLAFMLAQLGLAIASHLLTTRRHKMAQDLSIEATTVLQTKLRNAETVEALGMREHLERIWSGAHQRHALAQADAQEIARRLQAASKFMQYLQQALILSVGAVLAIDGKISAGAMIACNALMGNALRPISTLVQVWKQFVDVKQSYGRIEEVLKASPPRPQMHAHEEVRGQISIRRLTATAPGRTHPILSDLSADFASGEVIAIVGPSGAGKSTLARCLLGIWPDVEGHVELDGHPIEGWSRESLGPSVGYLPQDIGMFEGTIAENIARFSNAEPLEVIEAANRTGIHDMVLRLPRGYDTPIGEAGTLLSGGQRQRIGLARAILGSPRLLVLDEPNANLDDVGEAALARTVLDLKAKGTTVFMVVHQPQLLAIADRVLMLDNGRMTKLLPVQVRQA